MMLRCLIKDQGIISKPEFISHEQEANIFRETKKLIGMTNTLDLDMATQGNRSYYNGLWKASDRVEVEVEVFTVLLILIVANEHPNIFALRLKILY